VASDKSKRRSDSSPHAREAHTRKITRLRVAAQDALTLAVADPISQPNGRSLSGPICETIRCAC